MFTNIYCLKNQMSIHPKVIQLTSCLSNLYKGQSIPLFKSLKVHDNFYIKLKAFTDIRAFY